MSIAIPSAGPPTEHALIGPIGVGERKHAPTSVPPVQLMIGTREPPTSSNSQRYGSGFHGSPVVTNVRSDDRSLARRAVRQQRARERRREPERGDALLLDGRQSRSGVGQSGAPSAKTIVAPTRADADDGPRPHDPAHVRREVHDVARVHVGLVGDLAGDRDEEAALHVHDALRRAGRAGRVREQVRRLRVDLRRRQHARETRRARTGRAPRARRSATRAAPPRGSRASAPACRGVRTRPA